MRVLLDENLNSLDFTFGMNLLPSYLCHEIGAAEGYINPEAI